MKRKANVVCVCNKAGEACKTCPQGLRIKPNKVFYSSLWTWDGKINK